MPDIRVAESRLIMEDQVVDLALKDQPVTDETPLAHDGANSIAIAQFDTGKDHAKGGMRKLIRKVTPGRKAKKPILNDLRLHEYVARGWDVTNNLWRNTVWPTLDDNFIASHPSASRWNLVLDAAANEAQLAVGLKEDAGSLTNLSSSKQESTYHDQLTVIHPAQIPSKGSEIESTSASASGASPSNGDSFIWDTLVQLPHAISGVSDSEKADIKAIL
ncbi:hypothetical protein C8R43DRAFT_20580 [Mycena crocata]|nr:hypothetical protein C8R43DRAFT_20580 [Mycena crocata]